jgi:hypothetical protein
MTAAAVPAPSARRGLPRGIAPAALGGVSALERMHEPYFVQKVGVGRELMGRPRLDVLREMCAGRRVLHVGCVDWPITDPKTSLHLQLEAVCARLDGFDVHAEAFDALRPHVSGQLFSEWGAVTGEYDLVLVPEVLEHVADVAGFLRQLGALRAPSIVLTVPDAYQCMRRHFDYLQDSETFVEIVHPDHNCWYTPYTLTSVLRKYTDWQLDGLWFFNHISLLARLSKAGRGESGV